MTIQRICLFALIFTGSLLTQSPRDGRPAGRPLYGMVRFLLALAAQEKKPDSFDIVIQRLIFVDNMHREQLQRGIA